MNPSTTDRPIPLALDRVSALEPLRRDGAGRAVGGLLREISLELRPGRCLALFGGRDAGGSLLLDVIAGYRPASTGRILLDGTEAGSLPARGRRLAVVSERDPLFPHLSVRDNIAFPLRIRATPPRDRQRRVDDALALLGLEALADRRPSRLDEAAAIRTAIARALVSDPRVVLLDNPFAHLESAPRDAMQRMVRRLVQARGLTLLLVTADRNEAMLLGDEIGILDGGTLHQVGLPQDLLNRPADPTVARLLGDANLLTGRVLDIDDEIAIIRLSSGHAMEAEIGEPLEVGALGVVCIRPERIATAFISRPDLELDASSLPATLLEAIHFGDHLRLRFRLDDGTELLVRRPPAAAMGDLQPDRPARLAWQPHQARVFMAPSD